MDFDKWYHLIYLDENIPIRSPPSKHQAKIQEIIDAIKTAKEQHIMVPLLEVKFIDCSGSGLQVNYCRYLQYVIDVLKNEGSTE